MSPDRRTSGSVFTRGGPLAAVIVIHVAIVYLLAVSMGVVDAPKFAQPVQAVFIPEPTAPEPEQPKIKPQIAEVAPPTAEQPPEIQFDELSAFDNIFLIAESESTPIGYAQLIMDSKEESLKGTRSLEIRRIYSSQEYIGKGVGKELMSASIQEAKQRGCDSIWLGVWEKNPRAISFYKQWGFKEVGTHIFHVGDDPQMDFIMELALV